MLKKQLLSLLVLSTSLLFAQSLTITTTVCSEAESVRITGPWWQWNSNAGPVASDNGDNTWTFSFDPAPDEDMEYLLVVDGVMESLVAGNQVSGDWSCTPITDQATYANRQWIVGSGDVTNVYGTCGDCSVLVIYGCMDANAANFNPQASEDDGSCVYGVSLPVDFEGPDYSFTDFDGGNSEIIENPYSSGINTSAHVVEHIRDGGQFYAGTYLTINPVDFSGGSVLTMKTYTPTAGIPIHLKLEAETGESHEVIVENSVANAWEELVFDFPDNSPSGLYTRAVIILNMGEVGDGSAASTYYFDDLGFASGPISGCTDPEAINYNSGATIDDGSCIYPEATLQITVTACALASEVSLTGPFWGWDGVSGPVAEDNGDGTWTFFFDPAPEENMEYLIIVDGVIEDLVTYGDTSGDWSCTPVTNFSSYANRLWEQGTGDVADIYYGTCEPCENSIGIEEYAKEFVVYPNPTNSTITLPTSVTELLVFDVFGKLIFSQSVHENIVDVSSLNAGIYTIKILDDLGVTSYSRLIKK